MHIIIKNIHLFITSKLKEENVTGSRKRSFKKFLMHLMCRIYNMRQCVHLLYNDANYTISEVYAYIQDLY